MRISDWSSDVCSSDLAGVEDRGTARGAGLTAVADAGQCRDALGNEVGRRPHVDDFGRPGIADRAGAAHRPEERRSGKECVSTGRSRWSPDHDKKNKQKYTPIGTNNDAEDVTQK